MAEKINNFEKNKSALSPKIEDLQKQKQGYTSISELNNEINRIEQQINEQKCILEELSCVKSSKELRAELNNYSDGKKLLEKYDVKRCFYGHLHGYSHGLAVQGLWNGVDYKLVSADFLDFKPFPVIL